MVPLKHSLPNAATSRRVEDTASVLLHLMITNRGRKKKTFKKLLRAANQVPNMRQLRPMRPAADGLPTDVLLDQADRSSSSSSCSPRAMIGAELGDAATTATTSSSGDASSLALLEQLSPPSIPQDDLGEEDSREAVVEQGSITQVSPRVRSTNRSALCAPPQRPPECDGLEEFGCSYRGV